MASTIDPYLATTLQQAQANTLAAVTLQVANSNTNLKSNYMTAFSNWLISWNAGRISDKSTAPAPPLGFVVGYFNDPTTGPGTVGPYSNQVVQWAYPALGTVPVCDMPPIPNEPPPQSTLPPNHLHIGAKETASDVWWSAGSDDTFPSGQKTPPVTSDDGVNGLWEKFGAPVGQGWYLLLQKI